MNLFPADAILPEADYHCITLSTDVSGKLWSSAFTHWVGYADADRRIEIRELSRVKPEVAARNWESLREPFLVVNDDNDFARWFLSGGHALITPLMVKRHIPWEAEPRECVCEGFAGWTSVDMLPKGAFNKAPTPKLRIQVLKRDRYRCIICGRRPADHTDIELHVHHIQPFGSRGVTTEPNLITLCHTCHKGLDPHFEWSLYELIDPFFKKGYGDDLAKKSLGEYLTGVHNYRRAIAGKLSS